MPTSSRRWLLPAVLVILWLAVGGPLGSFQGKLAGVQENDNSAFLPAEAESTQVIELQRKFSDEEVLPAIVIYERTSGLTREDQAAVADDAVEFADLVGVLGEVSPPIPSEDGQALQVIVPIDANLGDDIIDVVEEVRAVADDSGPDSFVTGPAGILGDFVVAFESIDGLLLIVTAAVVALILVLVYRSPLLPVIVLVAVGLALGTASAIVYALTSAGVITLNGQSQGILLVLVFGAATDYALLLISRYREELRRHESKYDALRVALRATALPILASGGTVMVGVLCLLFSELNSNRGLGPVAAIGIASSLLVQLTFLPAVLALFGRAAFWPVRPRHGSDDGEQRGIWARVAALVGRRPRAVWVSSAAVLLVAAAFVTQLNTSGIAQTDVFLTDVPSVAGQEALGRHYPAGTGSPAVIVGDADALDELVSAVEDIDGVGTVTAVSENPAGPPGAPAQVVDGLVQLNAVLDDPADSKAAVETVRELREVVHDVPDAAGLVGGFTAIQLDTQDTAARDQSVIIPIITAVIFVILALLLRALVAPVLLIATVVLSFLATLGVSALVFEGIFGFPGSDPGVVLFGFIFLVALGIDYNIFLMTRVREESLRVGTRQGVLTGLRVTGGVITSAGVVLAATFSALGVLPLLFLAQIAFIVAFGVLLDTTIVRSLLVPALTLEIGEKVWWPSSLAGRERTADAGTRVATDAVAR
ncbi:MAG: MMPL family transporter [Geodermatophilaceae bacterium]|nr:MMPL family transporter [Geodermatophilaceae bacterium]